MRQRELELLAMALTKGMSGSLMARWFDSDIDSADFFRMSGEDIRHLLGLDFRHSLVQANRKESMEKAVKEAEFIQHHSINMAFVVDDNYPVRLKELSDAPAVIFSIGSCSLNMSRTLSVVGTRRPTPYGVKTCQNLVGSWCDKIDDLAVISGLAYGVDSIAHTSSMEHDTPTIAVVAHGLDRIYPAGHRDLAERIVRTGGAIVSEYPSGTAPYKRLFLERNRVIAGMADATVVIESGYRGGALSTANVAFNANREVFAVPGRIGDEMSEGCNKLIARQKAHVITGADSLIAEMMWESKVNHIDAVQKSLFPVLNETQLMLHGQLKKTDEALTPDYLQELTGLEMSLITSTLAEMEFEGLVVRYPGNRYALS